MPKWWRVNPEHGYRWWTVGFAPRGSDTIYPDEWWLKLGPVSFVCYDWRNHGWHRERRLAMCVLNSNEHVLATWRVIRG